MDTSQSDVTTVQLPDEFTIAEANDIQQSLLRVFEQQGPIRVNAGDVSRTDTAALQLMYVFQRALNENGAAIHWLAVSEAFTESAKLLGLDELLALPAAG